MTTASFASSLAAHETAARRSLAAELGARKVPILPRALVKAHKYHTLRRDYSALGYAGVRMLLLLLDLCSQLMSPVFSLADRLKLERRDLEIISGTVLGLVAGGLLSLWFGATLLAYVLIVPALAIAIGFFSGFLLAWFSLPMWQCLPLEADGALPRAARHLPPLPSHIQARARQAQEIPGTHVLVEYYGADPLATAVRGYGWFAERETIGAWSTHTALDQY